MERVAVKIYNTKLKKHKNIHNEVKILEELDHPNIIKIREMVETPDKTHLVLEYAEGISLLKHIKSKGKLPEKDAKNVFR